MNWLLKMEEIAKNLGVAGSLGIENQEVWIEFSLKIFIIKNNNIGRATIKNTPPLKRKVVILIFLWNNKYKETTSKNTGTKKYAVP